MTVPFGGLTPQSGSNQTARTVTYRMLSYKYGNGYEAMLPDGANPVIEAWTISFDVLNAADSATLEAWLTASPPWVIWNGDGAILSASKSYSITPDGWQVTIMPGNVNGYQFSVVQRF